MFFSYSSPARPYTSINVIDQNTPNAKITCPCVDNGVDPFRISYSSHDAEIWIGANWIE